MATTTVRSTTRGRQGYIYAPLDEVFYPKWKITITDQDSTVYTIADMNTGALTSNYLISANVTLPVTDKLPSASISFADPIVDATGMSTFYNKFVGGEIVRVYADYTDATSLLFYGKLDNPKYKLTSAGLTLDIDARSYPELTDRAVIGRCVNSTVDVAICSMLEENGFTDITLAFWNGPTWATATYNSTTRVTTWTSEVPTFPTTRITTSWQNKKPLSLIAEHCEKAGLGCYLERDGPDMGWYLKLFLKDTIRNNIANATFGQNLIAFDNYGYDNTGVYNSVTVYGKQESSNIITVSTQQNLTSIAALWQKDLIKSEGSLATDQEVREKCAFELGKSGTPKLTGSVTIVGNNTIKPGEQILVAVPQISVSGFQTLSVVKHTINKSGYITALEVEKKNLTVAKLFKEKIDIEQESQTYVNLNAMKDSYTIFFDETSSKIADHNLTQELDGKLSLMDNEVLGTATSDVLNTDYNVTSCEFRKYSNFPVDAGDSYEVSNDGGVNWETYDISSGTVHTFNTTGNQLCMRVTLRRNSVNATSPAYESVCLLYK